MLSGIYTDLRVEIANNRVEIADTRAALAAVRDILKAVPLETTPKVNRE